MSTLYDVVLQKKQACSQITANPTLAAIDGEYCKLLDSLVSSDKFIANRVCKTIKELKLAGGIDYNDHYRNAYDIYNEAVCYHIMKNVHNYNVKAIPEQADSTPDFEVESCNKQDNQVSNKVFVEVKSLAFCGGNLQYKQVQQDSLNSNIELEEQRLRGKQVCSSFYAVSPLGNKGRSITTEIEEFIKKINNNIKREQFHYVNGNDTILFIDLGQFIFPFSYEECLPVYPDLLRKCCITGKLWMIAFGEEGDRVFSNCEFEGRCNFDKKLSLPGILNSHDYIKGIIFSSGIIPTQKRLYGFFRHNEKELPAVEFLCKLCEFCNDDRNTKGWKHFPQK